ncbi:hypothetical protein G169_gp30 [Pseudomonas phage AF]|uniref:hypothetical protein n=1 Tax=Pseudomonas phage AF TaxID=1235689 RepID=UPI0002970B9B|nr:hypothetical protein G169_gp30 [Pseudomonas phage AF]AFV50644.1 hypothetical protein AF_030 [Pseudomonas phage AF]
MSKNDMVMGEPVALPERRSYEESFSVHGQGHIQGWNACLDEIAKLGPLYSRPVQGEPVAWGAWRKSLNRFHYIHDDGSYMAKTYGEGSESAQDFDLIPLYTNADPGEVERLRAENKDYREGAERYEDLCEAQRNEIKDLRALLARSAKLARGMVVHPWADKFASLAADIERIGVSVSAEPSAPVDEMYICAACMMGDGRPHSPEHCHRVKILRAEIDELTDGARAALERKP